MANPDAPPDAPPLCLFLKRGEDPVRAEPRFEQFVRDMGGRDGDEHLENSLFLKWTRLDDGDGVLFRKREQRLPNGSLLRAHVVHIGEELVNNSRQCPPPSVPSIQNKTSSAVS